MVAISSGTLLITGGSGYIGAWIVKSAVNRGYSVVAAVRTDAQGKFLVNRFPEYHGKVTYVLVPVIDKEGAYDEVVKDVDAIIHAASPVIFKGEPEVVLRPAIRGALGILESAHKYGKNVKRVVLTSSSVAIGGAIIRDGKLVRDETVWNTRATTEVETRKDADLDDVYAASKTRAEQSSWAWVKEHKPTWDFVTILPPYVWGPYIHQPGKPHFGSSAGLLLDNLLDSPDTSGTSLGDCADVRDTANIHVLALETPDAGGERVLIGVDYFAWQDVYDIFNSAGFPNVNVPGKTTRGAGKHKEHSVTSTAKAFKLWPNFRYHTFESSIRELGEQLVKDGYLTAVSD